MGNRTREFRIGRVHGKLNPDDPTSEAALQRQLFLIGKMQINFSSTRNHPIRIVAYEIPLFDDAPRTKSIDLLGYDSERRPFIIELKKSSSMDRLPDVASQISEYSDWFQICAPDIENEIKDSYLWNDFRFSAKPVKMILAPRDFYRDKDLSEVSNETGIVICSFSDIASEADKQGRIDILDRFGAKGFISLKVENRKYLNPEIEESIS